jgi:hypothetical protein
LVLSPNYCVDADNSVDAKKVLDAWAQIMIFPLRVQNAGASVPQFPGVAWRLAAAVDKWLLEWPGRAKSVGEEPPFRRAMWNSQGWLTGKAGTLQQKARDFKPQYRSRRGPPIGSMFQA